METTTLMLEQLALALLAASSSAALAYAGLLLLRVELLVKSENPAPLGLLLLSVSEASAAGLVIAGGETAYLLYLFSNASFAMGGALLAWGRRQRSMVAAALPLLYAGTGDLMASIIGIYSGLAARGPARALLLLAGASFIVRLAGLLLLPAWQGALLLAVGESSRAIALAGLALAYAPIRGGAGGG